MNPSVVNFLRKVILDDSTGRELRSEALDLYATYAAPFTEVSRGILCSSATMEKVQRLVSANQKIPAIKALREECRDLGLKEAKDAVENPLLFTQPNYPVER